MKKDDWTQEEIDYLKQNYHSHLAWELAAHLGRNVCNVKRRMSILSLKKSDAEFKALLKRKRERKNTVRWTSWMIDHLKNNYHKMTNRALAEHYGFNGMIHRVEKKLMELKLRRSKEDLLRFAINRIQDPLLFLKLIKIEKGPKSEYHRKKWIKINGIIPDGEMLYYSNGDTTDYHQLTLIKRKKYRKIYKERERKKKQFHREQLQALKRLKTNKVNVSKRRELADQKKKYDDFMKGIVQKDLRETAQEQLNMEKVPIRLNERTVIFVKKDLCIQKEDGSWIKR